MKKILPMSLLFFLIQCGSPALPAFKSLVEEQPQVTQVEPSPESQLSDPISILLEFSQRIDLQHMDDKAIVLLQGPVEKEMLEDPKKLMEGLEAQGLTIISTQVIMDGEERRLTVQPTTPLIDGIYYLVVTPLLLSVTGIPFNQTPGQNTTSFIATYYYGDTSPNEAPSLSGEEGGTSFGTEPSNLVINEILYDGKESETDGESFVELYGTPGADISLYRISFINGSDGEETDRVTLPAGSLIPDDGVFIVADLRTNSTTNSKVANHDYLDQLDPQNGPDAVQLFDRNENLVDSVTYGEGAVELSSSGFSLVEGLPAPDLVGGHSLSRVGGVDTQDNFVDFVDLTTPTPGLL